MEYEIQSSHPGYDETDRKAVNQVLKDQYTAEGPATTRFLNTLNDYVGLSSGVTTSSGTAALHLLLEAMDVGTGDEVLLPSYTCQSLLHPILHVGATPRPVDVSPNTFSLSLQTVKPHVNENTALIILVHTFGYPVQAEGLFNLGIPVLEDLAQAVGAKLPDGSHVGQRGLAAMGSLYATKQLSAGYGGFLLTNDEDLSGRINDLKHYDEREDFSPAYNFSLSDLNAALALNQLEKHEDTLAHQRVLAERYDSALESLETVDVPNRPSGHALYRYVVSVPNPDSLIAHMNNAGIEVKRPVFEPLHHSVDSDRQPVTEELHNTLVLLPLHPGMTEEKVDTVLDHLKELYE